MDAAPTATAGGQPCDTTARPPNSPAAQSVSVTAAVQRSNQRRAADYQARALTSAEAKKLARLGAARQEAMKRYDATHEKLRVFVLQLAAKTSEAAIARVGQVDRMAVRRWRGKQ